MAYRGRSSSPSPEQRGRRPSSSSTNTRPTSVGALGSGGFPARSLLDRNPRLPLKSLRRVQDYAEALQAEELPAKKEKNILTDVSHALFDVMSNKKTGSVGTDTCKRLDELLGSSLSPGGSSNSPGGSSKSPSGSSKTRPGARSRFSRQEFAGVVHGAWKTLGKRRFLAQLPAIEDMLNDGPVVTNGPDLEFTVDPVFSDLHSSPGCVIKRPEFRGITLRQLGALQAHIQRRCGAEGWYDCFHESSIYKQSLVPETINLYQVLDWVIKPATRKRKCSYVELVAGGRQSPRWFVSHWWGEAVFAFVACLGQHAKDRGLDEDSPYWVCAYANNQWKLDEEIADDPECSPFRLAMNLSEGTVSVLDREAVCYSRIWCCYEVHTALVTFLTDDSSPHKYDMYTDAEEGPVGITDGFVPEDLKSTLPSECKRAREKEFPNHLVDKALRIELQKANASKPADKRRILNCIAGPMDPNAEPPREHRCYDELNFTLRGRFALAGLRSALEAGKNVRKYFEALAKSRLIRVDLSFYDCQALTDAVFGQLVESLPRCLQEMDLDVSFCSKLTDASVEKLMHSLPPALDDLALSFMSCTELSSEGLGVLTREACHRPIQGLRLGLYGIRAIRDCDVQTLAAGFCEGLERLHLDLSFCWELSDLAVEALAEALPRSLEALTLKLRALPLTEAPIKRLAGALPPQLKELILDLYDCEAMGDDAAEALAAAMPSGLQLLNLSCCGWQGFTDVGLKAIAGALPGTVRHLELLFGENLRLTNQGVQALGFGLGPSLLHLKVGFKNCKQFRASSAWVPLASALPDNLEYFELCIAGCLDPSPTVEAIRRVLDRRGLRHKILV